MDIPSIQAFLAVTETGSFSRAAEQIFITQPAVSKRISSLEATLGVALFDRIGRTVQLTDAGRALQEKAYRIISEVEDVERLIRNMSGEVGGHLRMAASHHIGLHRLPQPLQQFHNQHPTVALEMQFMDSEGACRAVEHGDIELAVVTLPKTAAAALDLIHVWDDPLEIIVGKNHALAQEKVTSIISLLNYPAILPGQGTYTREIILSALSAVRDGIQVGMATNYMEVLKMLASIGFGWSALPHTLIDESLFVVHINNITISRSLGIVVHRERTLSNAAKAMIDTIRQHT
ncbi:MAG: LysR family transcriptional regulator [Acidiferrobacterales bacterium]